MYKYDIFNIPVSMELLATERLSFMILFNLMTNHSIIRLNGNM